MKFTDTRVLWPALFAGPGAWVVQLQGVYALSAWATEGHGTAPLHALSAACLLATIGGGLLAWRAWRTVGGWPSGTEDAATGRVRYLAVLAMHTSPLFACVIVAQWVAVALLPLSIGGG